MTLCNENAPILVNEEMGCNIWLMTVRAPEIASTARPGQFVHVKVPGMGPHPAAPFRRVRGRCGGGHGGHDVPGARLRH